jgi:hypothetical protein
MTRQKISLPRPATFFPSEASVSWTDQHGIERVTGACLRQVWYRLTGTGEPSKPDPYSEWIFALGKAVEQILIEQWKCMGILVGNNIKFYDAKRNISGELDVVLQDPESSKLFGVEVKSFYGYNATKEVCGNTKVVGHPKTSQLLQTLIYVDLCKDLGILDYFKLVYYARDSAHRKEFDVTVIDDNGQTRPVVDGVVDYRFTMENVYSRYKTLKSHIESNTIPPRDYSIAFSPEKVKQLYELGEVSETAMKEYKRNPAKNPVSNWQCNYCPVRKHCWSKG